MEGPDQIFDASSYVTSDIEGKVKLRLDESTAEYPPMSLPSMLIDAAEKSPNQTALGVKRDGDWVKWTYAEYLKGRILFAYFSYSELVFLPQLCYIKKFYDLMFVFHRCSMCRQGFHKVRFRASTGGSYYGI